MSATAKLSAVTGQLTELGRELRRVREQERFHRPAPPEHGLVLDVGSGQAPDPRSAVVVDKYVLDDFERPGHVPIDMTKPLVVADGEALPFADGTFAYVVASHVLEHATDPVLFAGELTRVAGAGFVQVPSREAELVYGWAFHPWLVDLDGQTLVFEPRDDDRPPPGGPAAHAAFHESMLARLGWSAHRSRWHHSIHWTGAVQVRVAGERRFHEQAELDVQGTIDALAQMGRAGRLRPLPDDVRAALRCPACRATLTWDADSVTCDGCANGYPVAGGVPLLLREAALEPVAR